MVNCKLYRYSDGRRGYSVRTKPGSGKITDIHESSIFDMKLASLSSG